ncbi:MAG: hypothetical protein AAB606_02685, partial [Patescibacteria group bacterium]
QGGGVEEGFPGRGNGVEGDFPSQGQGRKMQSGFGGQQMGGKQQVQQGSGQRKFVKQKKLDSAKMTKSFDKAITSITKSATSISTKLAKATTDKKKFSIIRGAVPALGKLCRYTVVPQMPVEVVLDEEFDCQGFLEDTVDVISNAMDEGDVETAVTALTDAYSTISESVSSVKAAVDEAVISANEEIDDANAEQEQMLREQEEQGGDMGAEVGF